MTEANSRDDTVSASGEASNAAQTLADRVRSSVHKIIVGKDRSIDLALTALLCRGHALIEDVPGTGKTTLAKALAWSLGCDFRRIQFTPDLMPTDVLGVNLFNMQKGEFEFRPGPVFSQILLADEINRATPRTQSALLEAMQERQASIDGVTRALPQPFMVMATLNPIEMEGTFPLPEAQVDRFLLRLSLGYPNREEEAEMLVRFREGPDPDPLPAVTDAGGVAAAQAVVDSVRLEATVQDYVLDIVAGTRSYSGLRLGASPRASLALQRSAQAWAAMHGREYVLPDDVKELAGPVLAHRLIVASQARLRGSTATRIVDEIVEDVVANTSVPMER